MNFLILEFTNVIKRFINVDSSIYNVVIIAVKLLHNGLHFCLHGSIKESYISISDSNDASIKKKMHIIDIKKEKKQSHFLAKNIA